MLLEVLERPRRVLDLGTGDGVLLALVRSRWPDVEAVGVDFSADHARGGAGALRRASTR